MKAEHSYEISYQATRDLYKYTDCLLNDTAHISSFYSGKELSGTWDSGATWNREHTWPNSKGLNGNDENDIMMLRPTSVSENSSRGNTAYGEGSSYYDPGESVRGDCARIVLYVYVRWGNTSKMWGTSGVIENLDILLKWMEEDPVDTWEMGRNDAVESITGTRNVFVDYPEYAWLLFGEEIPDDMSTPSGIAKNGSDDNSNNNNNNNNNNDNTGNSNSKCTHADTRIVNKKAATCTKTGYTGDTYCVDCDAKVKSGTTIEATGHKHTELKNAKAATCTEPGYTGDTYCKDCDAKVQTGTTIAATGHKNTELQGVKDATCTEAGYDGDVVCKTCGVTVQVGQIVTVPGSHTFGDWVVVEEATATTDGSKERSCSKCEYTETETIPATGTEDVPETGTQDEPTSESESKGSEAEGSEDLGTEEEPTNPLVVGAMIAIPSVCALGGIVAVLLKRRTHR